MRLSGSGKTPHADASRPRKSAPFTATKAAITAMARDVGRSITRPSRPLGRSPSRKRKSPATAGASAPIFAAVPSSGRTLHTKIPRPPMTSNGIRIDAMSTRPAAKHRDRSRDADMR